MHRKPHKAKILKQFLMFVLPFVILAVSATSALLMWSNYIHYKTTISKNYRNIIRTSSGEIGLFMAFALKNLEAVAWVLATGGRDPYAQKMALTAFNHINSEFKHVSLISRQGKVIATTRWQDDSALWLDAQLLQKAAAGRSGFSHIRFGQEQFPQVALAAPTPGFAQSKDIVWGVLDLKFVWNVLEGINIGRSGQVYLMDGTGKYIAHRKIDRVLTTSSRIDGETLKTIRNTDQPVTWVEKTEEETFYCLSSCINQLGWIVTLRQPTKEIYHHFFQNLYWAGLITILICAGAIVFGFYHIKRFLNPINTLHQQVRQITSGDLGRKVAVTSFDEIGELGHAFNDMTDALQEMIAKEVRSAQELAHAHDLAVLGTSASKVTHEVGNLLNNVGMSAIALRQESLSPRGEEALAKMEKEAARVKTFIQNFLQFAKPPELQLKPIALDLVIQEAMAVHAPRAEKQNITLTFEWPDDAPHIPADIRMLYQAFNNLIKNGIEAMEAAGVLAIAGAVNQTALTLTVRDSGPGISPEHLDRIFAPFFTTKGKNGTGLGMAIVKSIITAHRGTITCQSEPGQGTCFQICLPLR
jgi:signal transduction histidine kinase